METWKEGRERGGGRNDEARKEEGEGRGEGMEIHLGDAILLDTSHHGMTAYFCAAKRKSLLLVAQGFIVHPMLGCEGIDAVLCHAASCSLCGTITTTPVTHSATHSPSHSLFTPSSLTRSLTRLLTHSLPHSLTEAPVVKVRVAPLFESVR